MFWRRWKKKKVAVTDDPTSFGSVAMRVSHITQEQLQQALEEQKKKPDKRIGGILHDFGFLPTGEMMRVAEVQKLLREQESDKKYEGVVEQVDKALSATVEAVEGMDAFVQSHKGRR